MICLSIHSQIAQKNAGLLSMEFRIVASTWQVRQSGLKVGLNFASGTGTVNYSKDLNVALQTIFNGGRSRIEAAASCDLGTALVARYELLSGRRGYSEVTVILRLDNTMISRPKRQEVRIASKTILSTHP